MSTAEFSTESLDYLQRTAIRPEQLRIDSPLTLAPPGLRALRQIKGIGCQDKAAGLATGVGQASDRERLIRLSSEDVLIALYGYKIPFAFLLHAGSGILSAQWGVWSPQTENRPSVLKDRLDILGTALASLYPSVEDEDPPDSSRLDAFSRAGLVLGIPTLKPLGLADRALPVDRLVRALDGSGWAALVLAQPVDESVITAQRHMLLNELRGSQSAAQSLRAPSPLEQHYTQLLEIALTTCSQGQSVGMWRTAVYLLGHENSYYRLASLWRGIFSGEQSLPEPVRVWESPVFLNLAQRWALSDSPAPAGPSHYQHPFGYQTLLTSSQLSTYVHLPEVETGGFRVSAVPFFDRMPHPVKEGDVPLMIGHVIGPRGGTGNNKLDYTIGISQLTKHVFVAGVTGSGKTNTVVHLLKEAAACGKPFLVIEPAKSEYRSLVDDHAIGARVRVFTPGNERVSPFRLNPFEVIPGIPISVHLDLLRSVFATAFGMWTPLPQILERSLHELYADYGWDITSSRNARDPSGLSPLAYPTLTALSAKIDEVIGQLGYEDRIARDFRASLHTRLDSLRGGGKGRMLDVQQSYPMAQLLGHPTVMELEGMGDDDDKAFMMGLLLIRLAEHRIAERRETLPKTDEGRQSADTDLRHLLVIEEAHRLLSNTGGRRSAEEADPRGKAVETFANLLSEIRAYGQGVIVADQVPVKLAPDVIKNTNLKLAHRLVAEDDRTILAGAMAMNAAQCQALATLTKGQAVAFAEQEDAPLLIAIDKAKDDCTVSDERVARHMEALWQANAPAHGDLLMGFPACAQWCKPQNESACSTAQGLAELPAFRTAFSHLVLSSMRDPDAVQRLWTNVRALIRGARPQAMQEEPLLRCMIVRASHALASRRGAQAGWSYADTEVFERDLRNLLMTMLSPDDTEARKFDFQRTVIRLHERAYFPYPCCDRICRNANVCLYRYFVADVVAAGNLYVSWREAEQRDEKASREADKNDTGAIETDKSDRNPIWQVSLRASEQLIEWPEEAWESDFPSRWTDGSRATKEVAACFAQQMLASDASKLPRTAERIMQRILS